MTTAVVAFLLLEDERSEKVTRRILRDYNNPLELPETSFIANYRLNKESFCMVLDSIEGHLSRSKILSVLQLAASLRFLAEGSYQRSVGNDLSISLGRSTISTILGDVFNVMERFICPLWIQLEMDSAEKIRSREYFYSKYTIPSIIGCIDGTHVKIIKPRIDEHLYFNRKGYYSINAMIICDGQMKILAVDARYPGCSHDAFVWNVSSARQHFLRMYESGDRTSKLLGDCGYGIEPFLLTPYRDPRHNSQEYKFNMAHASARNIVERTIGVLKSRFRCLMSALHYRPEKVVKIIYVCCALHNICRNYKLEHNENDNIRLPSNDIEENVTLPPLTSQHSEALRIRDEISNSL